MNVKRFTFRLGSGRRFTEVSKETFIKYLLADRGVNEVYEYEGVNDVVWERAIDWSDLSDVTYRNITDRIDLLRDPMSILPFEELKIATSERVRFLEDGTCEYVFDGYEVYIDRHLSRLGFVEDDGEKCGEWLDLARDRLSRRFLGFEEI